MTQSLQKKSWLSIIVLAFAIFTLISTEMLPIGLLSPIAESFQTSEGTISFTISIPAFIAAFSAILTPLCFSKTDRKKLLLILMGFLLIANTLSALAPNFTVLLISRIMLGISVGGIWTIAGGLANRLVPIEKVAQATSIIFSGVAAASVLGIPLGVYLGDLLHWRFAFIIMAALTLLLLILLFINLPRLPATTGTSLATFKILFKNRFVIQGLIITLLLVTGHFMSYTFIRPLLQLHAGFTDQSISALLFTYGLLGILGNFILGNLAYRSLKFTIIFITISITATLWLLQLFGDSQIITIILMILWGFAYGAVSVSLMTWMFKAAPNHIELATALYITFFNFSIASGSFVGGQIYDIAGIDSTLFVASILTISAFLLLFFIPRQSR